MSPPIRRGFFIDNPYVGITEHPEENSLKVVLVNYTPNKQIVNFKADGLKLKEMIGNAEMSGSEIILSKNDSVVLTFEI